MYIIYTVAANMICPETCCIMRLKVFIKAKRLVINLKDIED